MTAQNQDQFFYEGREFAICAFTDKGIFVPEDFDLAPVGRLTCCYRGYECKYEVAKDALWIRELEINICEPKEILGGLPSSRNEWNYFVYERLPLPLRYTGGILIGPREKAAMILQLAFSLSHVRGFFNMSVADFFELNFVHGRLVKATDRSSAVQALQERALRAKWRLTSDEFSSWVHTTFDLSGYRDYVGSLHQ